MIKKIFSAIKLFQQGYGEYKRQIILMSVLGFFSGLLEGVGVNAIIPLFSFVAGSQNRGTDLISRTIEKFFGLLGISYTLKYLLIFICGLFIIKTIVLIIFNYINVRITTDYEKKTRNDLFHNTMLANWPYLLQQKIGYLEQVLITDINRGSVLLRHLSGTILLITNLLMYVAVALNISVLITFLTLVIGSLLFLLFKPMFYKARIIAQDQANITKRAANLINEHMIGTKTIKAAHKEEPVIKKADQYFEKLRQTSVRGSFIASVNNSLVEPVGIFFIVIIFAISYKLPGFNFASFAVIIYLIQKIFSYLQIAQNRWQIISEMTPYLSSTLNYQKEALAHQESERGDRNFVFKDSLEFQDVFFSYSSQKEIL